MKRLFIAAALGAFCTVSYSQIPQGGLILHLDAGIGFTGGAVDADTNFGYVKSFWQDQSAKANNVRTGPIRTWCSTIPPTGCPTTVPITGNANPEYVANALGTGLPAIRFDRNDYMETVPQTTAPANGLAIADNVTSATLFVVRAITFSGYQGLGSNDMTYPMVSLSNTAANSFTGPYLPYPPGTPPNIRDEFALMRDWGAHVTNSGRESLHFGFNQAHVRDHQCFAQTPSNKPVILTAALGSSYNDLDYYVNGVLSTNPIQVSTPAPGLPTHLAVNRLITIGASRSSMPNEINWFAFFDGYIYEVLAYNQKLNPAQIDSVNNYLKCKYSVNYAQCNTLGQCPQGCFFTPQLLLKHLGGCQFQVTANGAPRPGIGPIRYEWSLPGMAPFISTNPVQNFSMTSTISGTITVRMLAVNTNVTGDTSIPMCCDHTMTKNLWCEGGNYGESRMAPGTQNETAAGQSSDIVIYPNPTNNDLYVRNSPEGAMITVLDFTGRLISRTTAGSDVTRVSLAGHAPGLYMVNITDNKGTLLKSVKVALQ